MAETRWHGAELDAAMERAGKPADLGVCLAALDSRVEQVINGQLKDSVSDETVADVRRALVEEGVPDPDPELVEAVCIRSTIGGTFTYGIAVGLSLLQDTGEQSQPQSKGEK